MKIDFTNSATGKNLKNAKKPQKLNNNKKIGRTVFESRVGRSRGTAYVGTDGEG